MKLNKIAGKIPSALVIATLATSIVYAATNPGALQKEITPFLLSAKSTYDSQPSICKAADGTDWTAYVAYSFPMGDQVMVASRTKGKWSTPQPVSKEYTQIVRPTICAVGDTLWIFWTETAGKGLARVMGSRKQGDTWSAPQAINAENVAAQNQEVTTDGKNVYLTWQEFHNGQYDIMLRRCLGGNWTAPISLTNDKFDDWDPAIVRDSKGDLWVSWTSYRDGDYDLYITRADRPGSEQIRLSARGEYDLHPSLAADDKGRVWVAWDAITIPRHGWSGGSTITGANKDKYVEPENDPENPDQKALVAQIRLVCLEGGKVKQLPKASQALKPPQPYRLAHTALPKVSVSKDGTLWVGYRALMVDLSGQEKAAEKKTPAKGKAAKKQHKHRGPYWWDAFVQSFRADGWSAPQKLPVSDGTSEEVAMLATEGGLTIAYQMEHRIQNSPEYKKLMEHASAEEQADHHHDFGKVLGSNGDIFIADVSAGSTGAPAAKALVPRRMPLDKPVNKRVPREQARYETEIDGQKYQVLFGDLHKHSNISRCSSGNEPAPEDHYKYAADVCQYDFLAMSDHSEHTSDFNWWRIQKLADLYNIPGFFSVLYGYEWSASFPIGHHNVIFPSRPSPILRSNIEGTKNTKDLCDALAASGKQAIIIPHTLADPSMGTRWAYHDERFERLAEVFQACRGSYEYDGCPRQHVNATVKNSFLQDALAKDYKIGTICSSDHGWGTAYAVVYATENSRQATWQALHDRRCYGSTTYGLVLDFRVGGHFMGQEFSSDKPEEIKIYARGSAPIREIAIFSDHKLVYSQGDVKHPIGKNEVKVSWKPESLPSGTTYYYARVIQEDDEMAWSSPVWVTNRAVKVSEAK